MTMLEKATQHGRRGGPDASGLRIGGQSGEAAPRFGSGAPLIAQGYA